jgi:hypothetical protein
MADRSVVEDAARAAGHQPARWSDDGHFLLLTGAQAPWNPALDDGDCARLEAACSIDVNWYDERVVASISLDVVDGIDADEFYVTHAEDRQAARRLASTRAAAAAWRDAASTVHEGTAR